MASRDMCAVIGLLLCGAALALAGCADDSRTAGGMAVEEQGPHGPRIVFEPLELPDADVPFPNDLTLTRSDHTRTGLVWNAAPERSTAHHRLIREQLNKLDGFGPYAPVFVSFDGPLDLHTVTADSVRLVNIEPDHPREGEQIPLDLGSGLFPTLIRPGAFFGQDPSVDLVDMMFPADNLADADGDGEDEYVTHYDVATHTLVMRPMIPLAEGARHAVLITRAVTGQVAGGERGPVRSPFPYKAHAAQSDLVRRALDLADLDAGDLAFGWTYTTGHVVAPLVAYRDGLYGEGPLARLGALVEPVIHEVRDLGILHDADGDSYPLDPRDHPRILQAEFITEILNIISGIQDDPTFNVQFAHTDYLVFGSLLTPDLRMGEGGRFTVDSYTGEGEIGVQEVPFYLGVPKATAKHKPPFPVMIYFHGTGTSRMEALAITDVFARQGIATLAFDEVGHGPLIPSIPLLLDQNPDQAALADLIPPILAEILVPHRVEEFEGLGLEEALAKFEEIGLFAELAVVGRNVDENGDGYLEAAESFFFADPFRMCASFWQDLVDMMAIVRMLRALSPDKIPSGPLANPATASEAELLPYLLAGDFNADGVLDVGGPDVPLSAAGTSLGGFHSIMGAAIEPEIRTVTPIVAGGGLTDVLVRADLRFVTERLFLDVLGSVVVACPDEYGWVHLTQGDDADRCKKGTEGAFARVKAPAEGATVTLTNLVNGEIATAIAGPEGGFSVAVESDRWDPIQIEIERPGEPWTHVFASRFEGSGYVRNTPDFRRMIHLFQNALGRCDPINFTPYLHLDPLPGHEPTNMLMFNALGDQTVPISTGIAAALAAGLFGTDPAGWRSRTEALIEAGVADGLHVDVDDVRGDNPAETPALGVTPPVETGAGLSSIRFADVKGKHEYIAGYNKDGFDAGHLDQHRIAIYHRCEGRVIYDQDPECLQHRDCPVLDAVQEIEGCRP